MLLVGHLNFQTVAKFGKNLYPISHTDELSVYCVFIIVYMGLSRIFQTGRNFRFDQILHLEVYTADDRQNLP